MNIMKYYKGSVIFTVLTMISGYMYGLYLFKDITLALGTIGIMGILGILETSLSFDNAVANAKVLQTMSRVWQRRFLTWGMIIAVFGMRIVFPVIIVSVAGSISIMDALRMAIYDGRQYAEVLTKAHILIAGFGGAFLLLVGLGFFIDQEKETHWLKPIESRLAKLGVLKSSEVTIALLVIVLFSYLLAGHEQTEFIIASIFGIITHEIVASLGDLMGSEKDLSVHAAKSGFMSFLYLEVLDASFSFDGVIGAFVLSTNIFIIAGGLGIGAMFVRSMTVHLVETGTLSEYLYLESGAFWSILILAGIMFTSTLTEIPEIVTGILSVTIISFALIHSILIKKKNPEES
jgi:uncharacterized protein